jgi:hypothetical protein
MNIRSRYLKCCYQLDLIWVEYPILTCHGNMITTVVWQAHHTRLVGYFHTHINIWVDIRVQSIYQSNTGLDLWLWIMQILSLFSQTAMILRVFPPLYTTFWSSKHNDMKDAIGCSNSNQFFQSAMTLRVFPPLYLSIFFQSAMILRVFPPLLTILNQLT